MSTNAMLTAFDHLLRRDRRASAGSKRQAGPDPRLCSVDSHRTHGWLGQPRAGMMIHFFHSLSLALSD